MLLTPVFLNRLNSAGGEQKGACELIRWIFLHSLNFSKDSVELLSESTLSKTVPKDTVL